MSIRLSAVRHSLRGVASRSLSTTASSSSTAPATIPKEPKEKTGNKRKPRLVILGTGWGGFRFLRDLNLNHYDVSVISPRNHFLFTPLLTSTAVGTLEFRSIIEPIRQSNIVKKVEYYHAECVGIDTEKRTITAQEVIDTQYRRYDAANAFEVEYDKLVIGVGAKNNTFGIKGVDSNAFFMKELRDARSIRRRIVEIFEHVNMPSVTPEERKKMLNFVIVGGGPTGTEFAGEMADFFWQDLNKSFPHAPVNEVRITLLEASPNILSAFDKSLVSKALVQLRKLGVDVRTETVVTGVEKNKIYLADGSTQDYGLLVWSTGVGPNPLVQKSEQFQKDRSGRIVVDDFLRVKGHEDVYAIGDCASIEDNPLQATAQVAQQQAKYLAKELNALAKNEHHNIGKFHYHFLGMMTYVGNYKSLLDSEWIKASGFAAWVAWRSAYLTRLGTTKNKFQVPFDWFRTFVFGRDVTSF